MEVPAWFVLRLIPIVWGLPTCPIGAMDMRNKSRARMWEGPHVGRNVDGEPGSRVITNQHRLSCKPRHVERFPIIMDHESIHFFLGVDAGTTDHLEVDLSGFAFKN